MDAPEYQNVEPQMTNIFKQYSTPQGIVLRHQRLLWQGPPHKVTDSFTAENDQAAFAIVGARYPELTFTQTCPPE